MDINEPMDPQQPTAPAGETARADKEAALFEGASELAKLLYRESKKVRRMAERKLWWQANGQKPAEKPEKEAYLQSHGNA